MQKSIIKKLSETDIFRNASEEELSSMLKSGGEIIDYKSGEEICSPNSLSGKMCIVISGMAEVFSTENNDGTLLRRLGDNDIFGVCNLFSREKFVSRIIAKGKCKVLFISEKSFGELIESNRDVLYAYIEFLSNRIRFLNRKISYLTAGSAERRLAVYLASFESENVCTGLTLSALSDMLNVGRASLYRAFERLENDGYIRRDGANFFVLDRDGMLAEYNN